MLVMTVITNDSLQRTWQATASFLQTFSLCLPFWNKTKQIKLKSLSSDSSFPSCSANLFEKQTWTGPNDEEEGSQSFNEQVILSVRLAPLCMMLMMCLTRSWRTSSLWMIFWKKEMETTLHCCQLASQKSRMSIWRPMRHAHHYPAVTTGH